MDIVNPQHDARGSICIALEDERIWCQGCEVKLTPRAFAVLKTLLLRGNTLMTKSEILRIVWPENYVSEAIVKEYIRDIRHSLGDDPRNPTYIETVFGRGYRFIGNVHTVADKPGSATECIVAVVPFEHILVTHDIGDAANILCDCIIDGIMDCQHLCVVPRKYVGSLKQKGYDLPSIGVELNADFIVDGTINSLNGNLRVDAKLINAKACEQVWAKRYDCAKRNKRFFLECIGKKVANEVISYTQYAALLGVE